jgi:predicted DCC family thiol-disulfide oxidoreductase YuxK
MSTFTSSNPTTPATITVFFDNDCAVCKREVAFCKRLDKDQNIDWIDLRSQRQLAADLGIDFDAAMDLLHALDADGKLHIGLAGHRVMWAYLPGYRHLAALLDRHPRLASISDHYYRLFTRLRPGAFKARVGATASTARSSKVNEGGRHD